MNNTEISIADRLKVARIKAGFTSARAFAKNHHIPYITYSQHESGKRKLSPEIIVKYSELLAIDPSWLLTGKTEDTTLKTRNSMKRGFGKTPHISGINFNHSKINPIIFCEVLSEVNEISRKLGINPLEEDKIKLCIEIYNSIILYDFDDVLKNKILKSMIDSIIRTQSIAV